MNDAVIEKINRASKRERIQAMDSYNALDAILKQLKSDNPEIEIEETQEKIKLPKFALNLLAVVLRTISEGHSVSIVSGASEITTQAAAEIIGCSRPFLVKLLDEGKIEHTKIGRHRRLKVDDVLQFKKTMKVAQKNLLIEIMKADEESGLYDTQL